MRRIAIKKSDPSPLSTDQKAAERRIFLEERSKGLVQSSAILHRPDIVPRSHLDLSPNPVLSLKSDDLDEVEKYRKMTEGYEQRYEEQRELRELADTQVRELREKLSFYEGLTREVRVLHRESDTIRLELDTERGKTTEIIENHTKQTEQLTKHIGNLESLVSDLKADLKSHCEAEETLKSELKAVKSELIAAKTDTISTKTDYVSKEADRKREIDAVSKLLDEERKSKRSIELLYAELFEIHQKCLLKPAICAEKQRKPAFEAEIRDLETRLMLEIHKKSPKNTDSDRENHLNDTLNIKHYLETAPRSNSASKSAKCGKNSDFRSKPRIEPQSKRPKRAVPPPK